VHKSAGDPGISSAIAAICLCLSPLTCQWEIPRDRGARRDRGKTQAGGADAAIMAAKIRPCSLIAKAPAIRMQEGVMQFSRVAAGFIAVMAISAPALALAADNKLTLVIGGEAYDGPPKFTVSFDGKPLGEGVVASAIDTTTAGRFADATDKTKYIQTFDFKIPNDLFKPNAEIRIKLSNEAHGAVGSKSDRELYVQSVAVNGDVLPGDKLAMRSDVGIEPTAMLGDYLVVSEGATEGVAAAPSGGWPAAASVAETKPVAPAPVTAPPVIAAEAEPVKPASVAAPAGKSQEMAAVAAPAIKSVAEAAPASKPGDTGETVETASLNQSPEADIPTCGLSKSFQILGFNENSNVLTPRITRQLDLVAKTIGEQKCAVRLTGYSSTEGTYADNALFAIERAQNALHYLYERGVRFQRYSASGVGETTQFGADPQANRRVTVLVSP